MRRGITGLALIGILALVVALVLLSVQFSIFDGLWRSLDEADCTAQIRAHHVIASTGHKLFTPIDCPTSEVVIEADASEEAARHEVAEQLRLCWKRWGRGRLELFPSEGTYCHYCSYIDLSATGRELSGLHEYLATATLEGSDETYLSYLAAYQSDPARLEEVIASPEVQAALARSTYPPEQEYGVLFLYVRGKEDLRDLYEYMMWQSSLAEATGKPSAIIALIIGNTAGHVGGRAIGGIGPQGFILEQVGALTTTALSYATLQGSAYLFSEESEMDVAALIVLVPLEGEQLRRLGCDYAWASQQRPEGFYTV